MKTIFKSGVYNRVKEGVAESNVKYYGWRYVPKSEWKAASRSSTSNSTKGLEKVEAVETASKKVYRHKKDTLKS